MARMAAPQLQGASERSSTPSKHRSAVKKNGSREGCAEAGSCKADGQQSETNNGETIGCVFSDLMNCCARVWWISRIVAGPISWSSWASWTIRTAISAVARTAAPRGFGTGIQAQRIYESERIISGI